MGILILNLFLLKQDGDGVMDLFGSGYGKWPAHISMG
jgi:hypothetical protein